MGNLNVGRWLAGGTVAGLLMWIIEGAASQLYFDERWLRSTGPDWAFR